MQSLFYCYNHQHLKLPYLCVIYVIFQFAVMNFLNLFDLEHFGPQCFGKLKKELKCVNLCPALAAGFLDRHKVISRLLALLNSSAKLLIGDSKNSFPIQCYST